MEAPGTPLIRSVALWSLDRLGQPLLRSCWPAASDELPAPAGLHSGWEAWRESHFDDYYDQPDAARPCGATVTIPVIDGGRMATGLVTLGVQAEADRPAGLELWHPSGPLGETLAWRRGWYTQAAASLAAVSPYTRLPHRSGLPGLALELQAPAYLCNLGHSEFFVRAHHAHESGLHHGLAIPTVQGGEVLVLLSGLEVPLARRVELAVIEAEGPRSVGGHCRLQGDLFARRPRRPWGSALLQATAAAGAPRLTTRLNGSDSATLLDSLQADAVLTWPFEREGEPMMILAIWL